VWYILTNKSFAIEILDQADEFQVIIMDIANDIEMTLNDVCSNDKDTIHKAELFGCMHAVH